MNELTHSKQELPSKRNRKVFKIKLKADKYLYFLLILPVVYFVIFKYIPIIGNVIAFRQYRPGLSFLGEKWVGLKYVNMFITSPDFWQAFKNSITLSVLSLAIGFPLPIIFALLINEIKNNYAKKFIQTISYLPKFISTVIAIGMIKQMLSPSTGVINIILGKLFGIQPIFFVNDPEWFRAIYISTDIWQFMGWNAIIYLAALSGVNPELYESAMIDGANRFRQIIHVTIPGISSTIIITLILAVGYMLNLGFEKVLLLYTPLNASTSDILDTFVYRMGIKQGLFSYSTAVGLFNAAIALFLITLSNTIAKKLSDTSLF